MCGDLVPPIKIYCGLLPIMKAMFAVPNLSPTKVVLNLIGVLVGDVRLPMIAMPDEEIVAFKVLLDVDERVKIRL